MVSCGCGVPLVLWLRSFLVLLESPILIKVISSFKINFKNTTASIHSFLLLLFLFLSPALPIPNPSLPLVPILLFPNGRALNLNPLPLNSV